MFSFPLLNAQTQDQTDKLSIEQVKHLEKTKLHASILSFPFRKFFAYDHLTFQCTLDYGISVPAGISMPGGTFGKNNKRASWKITLKTTFFVANDTFLK